MIWVVLYGWILDRVNRVTGLALAMFLGGVGYTSMWLVDSPLDFAYIPAFIILSIGQMSVIAASMTLVGQEAEPTERGAVIAMNGFCGAVGILLAFVIGGRLFDAYGPSAPFRYGRTRAGGPVFWRDRRSFPVPGSRASWLTVDAEPVASSSGAAFPCRIPPCRGPVSIPTRRLR